MTKCWFCGAEMIWGNDFDYSDYGLDGEGIVAFLSCSNPDCNATANFYLDIPDDTEVSKLPNKQEE
jgi:hypothetical protein